MLNEICAAMLRRIIGGQTPVKLDELADAFAVSRRSVRYHLNKIDAFLSGAGYPALIRKRSVGIIYSVSARQAEQILARLEDIGPGYYSASRAERQDLLLAALLCRRDYVTMEQLARNLAVSRTTVVKDLRRLRECLEEYALKLGSSPNHGVKLIGEERNLRRAALALLRRGIEEQGGGHRDIAAAVHALRQTGRREISRLFDQVNFHLIERWVTEAEAQLSVTFSDAAFYGLVVHIAIAVQRMKLGKHIVMERAELQQCATMKEFAAASFIAGNLEKAFQIRAPYDEIGYIALHLLGSNGYVERLLYDRDWAKVELFTGQILQAVSEKLNRPDLMQDRRLFDGLRDHLRPALHRLKHDLYITNPILADIQSDYAELFSTVQSSMFPAENFVGKRFNEEEIGYFTLHFGAALEKLRARAPAAARVLVVCGAGMGTAQLLASRLQQRFQVKIAGILAHRKVNTSQPMKGVDIIVTTLPLLVSGIPCLQVNPLLPANDLLKLKQYLPEYACPPNHLLANTLQAIRRHCEIKDYNGLIGELAKLLNTDTFIQGKGGEQPLLTDLLTERSIALRVKADDWEAAVRAGGKLMVGNGLVEERYVDAMVNTVKQMGPYIVIVPGIAMPHARPEDGAIEVGMAVVTLEKPVEFGSAENDPVSVAVFLCAVDKVTHIKALAGLMALLEDEYFKTAAEQAKSPAELLRYIREKLKEEK